MSVGFIELLSILTALGGFGISPNPKAPAAAEISRFAVPDADLTAHVDIAAIVPKNYEALRALPKDKAIRDNPGGRAAIEKLLAAIEDSRKQVVSATGVDVVTDVSSATLWVDLSGMAANGKPGLLLVARGKFSRELPQKVSRAMGGTVGDVDGNPVVTSPGDDAVIGVLGVTGDTGDTLMLGTPALVKARLAKSWKRPAARRGSPAARLSALLDRRPFAVLASSPSRGATAMITRELGPGQNFAVDVATSHEFAALALAHDGVTWTWTDRTEKGYARAVLASEGILQLMRAGHFATRGLAKFLLASLQSYAGTSREIDEILRHKDDILALVAGVSGDGKFRERVTKQPRKRTVTVAATGRKFSDVLPIAGMAPLAGAAMWLLMSRGVAVEEPATAAAKPPAEPRKGGLLIRETYRAVKEQQRKTGDAAAPR